MKTFPYKYNFKMCKKKKKGLTLTNLILKKPLRLEMKHLKCPAFLTKRLNNRLAVMQIVFWCR